MKNTNFCMVKTDKLEMLVNKIIGMYQIVDDHCMIVEASLSHCERPRKGDMRTLNNSLEGEFFNTLESIGCPHHAMTEDDEEAMFNGILNMLELKLPDNEAADESEQTDFSDFLQRLLEVFSAGKPVTVTANINFNTEGEE